MGKQKKEKIRISFIGGNAESVTGSMTLVESKDFKILLECGLFQSNSVKSDYYVNKRKLPFKPKDIDYIFIGHCHADHVLLIPRLVSEGFCGKIICVSGTSKLFKIMAMDSSYIMGKDAELLNLKYGLNIYPIYNEKDVIDTLPLFDEYEIGEKITLNDSITFRFVPSGHIILSSQCELWLKSGNQTKKILFSSDLGNISYPKYFSNEFKPVKKCDLSIMECTYSSSQRTTSIKDRQKDLEKIKTIIENVCIYNKQKVLIPIFSLDRCQNIMCHLYNIFKDDQNFNIPIIIDSPLAITMCKLYLELLS